MEAVQALKAFPLCPLAGNQRSALGPSAAAGLLALQPCGCGVWHQCQRLGGLRSPHDATERSSSSAGLRRAPASLLRREVQQEFQLSVNPSETTSCSAKMPSLLGGGSSFPGWVKSSKSDFHFSMKFCPGQKCRRRLSSLPSRCHHLRIPPVRGSLRPGAGLSL